ncbi:MAG: mannosyltransferase [Piccolia ochrophora]|nr:MAG: mannosyltransferase [Piccolia ochrophora]
MVLYERFFGRFGTANFTVSAAMARALKEEYGVRSPIFALHDRPPSHFQSLSPQERSAFLGRLPMTTSHLSAILEGDMRLIVSSTSWTFDEDFSLLLDALVSYSEEAGQDDCALPTILAVITGKGPQRAHYQQAIAKLQSERKLVNVTIVTAWLSMEDYASLLGSADLGVSLHTSSSGLDLPMKVVDMFGAGLPVVGWGKFEAWSELVKEGENGRGFSDAAQLKDVLVELLGASSTALAHLKQGAIREGQRRWEDEWKPVAGRLLGVCD